MSFGLGFGLGIFIKVLYAVVGPPVTSYFLLLEDGVSYFLLEDGTSKIQLE